MKLRQILMNALLVSSLAFGQVAVMARPLSATAQVSSDWDRSSLSFVGSCSLACQQQLSATVCNVGSGNMTGSVAWELYFSTSGNPKNGTVIATGEVPAMPSTDPDTCHTLTYNVTQDGNYMFRVVQRPGHPGQGELWSTTCTNGCTSPSPTASPSPSASPSPTPSASPTASPSASPSPSPSVSPSPTAVATPSGVILVGTPATPSPSPSVDPAASPTPAASPSPSVTPSPTPSSNNSSSNSNGNSSNSSNNSSSSNDTGNGVGGSNSNANSANSTSSSKSSKSERGRGQVLGATTLADTGDSELQLAMIVLMAGAFITLAGTAYAYQVR